ncbi:MAG: alanine racemase [Nitrospirota bacterium]
MNRGAIAEISLSAIAHNFRTVKQMVKDRPVIAVVKADAYGHGAVEVSARLLKEGAEYLAVAYLGEAVTLREAGIEAPVLLLFDRLHLDEYIHFRLTPVLHSAACAFELSQEASRKKVLIPVHVKIDTGMGRLGLHNTHAASEVCALSELPGIRIEGLLSHFSEADLADRSFAREQLARFAAIRDALARKVNRKIFSHIANSAAVLGFEDAYLDAVRPGIMLYGYSPFVDQSAGVRLLPAMTLKTRILSLRNLPAGTPVSYGRTFITKKPARIGVLPLGYADGYSRLFSNNAEVIVNGRRAPVAGRVCMDTTMIDLTGVDGAEEDDEVVILGRQGDETVTADELAEKSGTISYDIVTSLGNRSQRFYVENH